MAAMPESWQKELDVDASVTTSRLLEPRTFQKSLKKPERTSRLTRLFNVRRNNKTVRKENLPEKMCAHCQRPFTWRKRWANCWDAVRYCSEACRRQRPKLVAGNDIQKPVNPPIKRGGTKT
jgi:hypothetical protein